VSREEHHGLSAIRVKFIALIETNNNTEKSNFKCVSGRKITRKITQPIFAPFDHLRRAQDSAQDTAAHLRTLWLLVTGAR
jgi:hypothetical protein